MNSSTQGFNPQYGEEAPTLKQIAAFHGEVLLEFGTPWCGHCQAARPAVEEALSEYPKLLHIKVYDGKGKRLGRAFAVNRWPTLIRSREGVEVSRLVRPLKADEVRRLLA